MSPDKLADRLILEYIDNYSSPYDAKKHTQVIKRVPKIPLYYYVIVCISITFYVAFPYKCDMMPVTGD